LFVLAFLDQQLVGRFVAVFYAAVVDRESQRHEYPERLVVEGNVVVFYRECVQQPQESLAFGLAGVARVFKRRGSDVVDPLLLFVQHALLAGARTVVCDPERALVERLVLLNLVFVHLLLLLEHCLWIY